MPSNLCVTVFGGGSLLEVQTLEYGVLAESLLYRQFRFLQPTLFVEGFAFGFGCLPGGFVILEQV